MNLTPSDIPERLLCLDTATTVMRLGLWQAQTSTSEGQWLFRIEEPQTSQRFHSSIMIPALQAAFSECGVQPKDIQGIALHPGPGSFTGIRTGLVTARTLAQFLNCRTYAINAFELLAPLGKKTLVLLDALRGNAYTALLTLSELDGTVSYTLEPCLVPLDEALSQWGGQAECVVASEKLSVEKAFLEESQAALVLDRMVWLVEQQGQRLISPWQALSPLYLQAPNITQRKP